MIIFCWASDGSAFQIKLKGSTTLVTRLKSPRWLLGRTSACGISHVYCRATRLVCLFFIIWLEDHKLYNYRKLLQLPHVLTTPFAGVSKIEKESVKKPHSVCHWPRISSMAAVLGQAAELFYCSNLQSPQLFKFFWITDISELRSYMDKKGFKQKERLCW